MKVVLISPYEIGRQPFALAEPAAWLVRAGFAVECIDLANENWQQSRVDGAELIAIHLIMHAGARLAAEIIPDIKVSNPQTRICVYGLYAPVNEDYFRSLGCSFVFGAEAEADIVALCNALRDNTCTKQFEITQKQPKKTDFIVPDRSGLPSLSEYSSLQLPDGTNKVVGFAESSRGCKHLCRHCPVVPVYGGKFRVVPVDVVLQDIRQQINNGAEHISFGDPDFLNGPGHARRIIQNMHAEFPEMTWDATIKIEHLLKHQPLLEEFASRNCLFITSAVESIEDKVLEKLEKGHTADDFYRALDIFSELDIIMLPTFVPFTPWTSLDGYLRLLQEIVRLQLINSTTPVQLSIRLLLPEGSRLLELDDIGNYLQPFDSSMLGYPWTHPDSRVDELQNEIQNWVMEAESQGLSRQQIFAGIWEQSHTANGAPIPELHQGDQPQVPQMSEPWYCCAEPTALQISKIDTASSTAIGV